MKRLFLALVCLALGGCGSTSNPGGYYKDDGPHERPPANLDRVADAVPRSEPLHKFANRPYKALGKQYVPMTSLQPYRERGASDAADPQLCARHEHQEWQERGGAHQ